MRYLKLCLLVVAVLGVQAHAWAEESLQFGPNDLRSLFHVAKSQNQNQVHYALRLDQNCRPQGKRPVFAYWRRMRSAGRVDAPLEGLGTTVYGASDRQDVSTTADGFRVHMYVKALSKVRIAIDVKKQAKGCSAVATTKIAGVPAKLSHAFLQLGALNVIVKYVDVVGHRLSDGSRVAERIYR